MNLAAVDLSPDHPKFVFALPFQSAGIYTCVSSVFGWGYVVVSPTENAKNKNRIQVVTLLKELYIFQ
jgi:hypothetical protein